VKHFLSIFLFVLSGGAAQFHMNDQTLLRNGPAPSYIAWWKADAITGYSDGQNMTNWVDSSGNGYDLTQTNAVSGPVYKTSRVKGLPAVNFGTITNNTFFNVPGFITNATHAEIFFVVRQRPDFAASIAQSGFSSTGSDTGANATGHLSYTDGNQYVNFGTTTRKTTTYPKLGFNQWRIVNYSTTTNDFTVRLDAVQYYNDATNVVAWGAGTNRWIGHAINSGSNRYFNGDIAEIVLYDSVLSTRDRGQTYAYLYRKYIERFSTPTTNNMAGWWKPEGLTNTVDGTGVENWPDSWSTNKLTQTSGSVQPVYKTGIVAGYPAVNFGTITANSYFDFPNVFSGWTAGEIYVVMKLDADPPATANTGIWTMQSDVANGMHVPYSDGVIYDGWGSTTRKTTINPSVTFTNWGWYNVYSAASAWGNRQNGKTIYTTASNTTGWAPTWYYFGRSRNSGGSNYYLYGYVAEILLYSAKLTDDQRAQTEAYIEQKYGIGFSY